jgi:hypothetical protein
MNGPLDRYTLPHRRCEEDVQSTEIIGAGYTASQLSVDGGYTITQLKAGGYSDTEIINRQDIVLTDLRVEGPYTASQLRPLKVGIPLTQLRSWRIIQTTEIIQGGYSATDLYQFSFNMPAPRAEMNGLERLLSASKMRKGVRTEGEYTASQLRTLKDGYTITQLRAGGYSDTEIILAGYSAK